MPTLTFTVTADGLAVRKSEDSFHMGPNRAPFSIVVDNDDLTNPHQLRIEKITFKDDPNGPKAMIPFTGQRAWLVFAGSSQSSTHKVRSKKYAPVGRYDYTLVLDSRETNDPEIVVDPALERALLPSTKSTKSTKKAKRAKSMKKKAAKKAKRAKKKSAKRKR